MTPTTPRACCPSSLPSSKCPSGGTADLSFPDQGSPTAWERYLRLHPYIHTLVVNAVGAGRAEHLADMLVELQKRGLARDVSFALRLYAPVEQQDWTGEALAELLRGEWSTATAADAFLTAGPDGLTPKLTVAVRPVGDLDAAEAEHAAHITFLFDVFGGERIDAAEAPDGAVPPVHGLVQDVVTEYTGGGLDAAWHKRPRHGRPVPLPGAEALTDLLGSLPAVLSAAATAVATGEAGLDLVPRTTLVLDTAARSLLDRAHRLSDWVVSVDRTMGVDFFDSPAREDRPSYVIDYEHGSAPGLGHHLVISSRSTEELTALLEPVSRSHGVGVTERHAGAFFDQLRLLSGRLALKLASASATQRTEVLGLALARLFLDYQGALRDQVLVPLDAHQDLYREVRRRADAVGEAAVLKRTDLALFDLDAANRTITCRLVEVKCYTSLGGLGAYEDVKAGMALQIRRSEEVLSQHFGRSSELHDRPDRLVKSAQLAATAAVLPRPSVSARDHRCSRDHR